MSLSWTEKYRPRTLGEVKGNTKAVSDLKRWAESWRKGRPKKNPAVILAGDPGIGKTSAALALANDMGWTVIELNASDARNYETINRIVTMGVIHDTFTETGEFRPVASGGRKLVVLDEADNLYERGFGADTKEESKDLSDRGGKKAIIEALSKAQQPIVLIVNDAYQLTKGRGAAIKRLCRTIWFDAVEKKALIDALRSIAMKEGVRIEDKVFNIIAEKADGDLRSAVNDLQTLAIGRKRVDLKDIEVLGYRDPRTRIYGALRTIFKTKSLTMAKDALRAIDETPSDILLWLDENLPHEYSKTPELIEAYHYLTRADIFLKRVYRRQYFGMWAYASELMGGGVSLAKKDINNSPVKYNFPMYIIKMSRTKGDRAVQDSTMRKLRRRFHTCTVGAREMLLTLRELMKRNRRLAASIIEELKIDEDELAYILASSDHAARLMDEIEHLEEREDGEEAHATFLDEYDEDDDGEEGDGGGKDDDDDKDGGGADDGGKGGEDGKKEGQSSLVDFGGR